MIDMTWDADLIMTQNLTAFVYPWKHRAKGTKFTAARCLVVISDHVLSPFRLIK